MGRQLCVLLVAASLAACVQTNRPQSTATSPAASSAPGSDTSAEGVDGLNVLAFDLLRADGVTAARVEHVEARTWRVTFPGLNARNAQVSGRSACCVTFSDFDFLGISSFDVTGPDIGGEDRVGVRAANREGPEHAPADRG